MDNRFKFEEEFDEDVISIELENLQVRDSVFYLFIKRVIVN